MYNKKGSPRRFNISVHCKKNPSIYGKCLQQSCRNIYAFWEKFRLCDLRFFATVFWRSARRIRSDQKYGYIIGWQIFIVMILYSKFCSLKMSTGIRRDSIFLIGKFLIKVYGGEPVNKQKTFNSVQVPSYDYCRLIISKFKVYYLSSKLDHGCSYLIYI